MDIKELLQRINHGLAAEAAKEHGGDPAMVAKLESQKSALESVGSGGGGGAPAGGERRELSRFGERPALDLESVEKLARSNGLMGPAGRAGGAQSKGWKTGHWSDVFADAVASSDSKSLTPSGRITVPSLSGGIIPINDRPTRLIDVIPIDTSLSGGDSYAFLRETVREHAAKEVAPGALKPTSKYSLKKEEDRVRVIAHLSEPMDRFTMRDVNLLRPYIDDSMRQGVLTRLDHQILLGDGTGENLKGLGVDGERQIMLWKEDLLRTTRAAITLLEDLEIYSGVFCLAPETWEQLELTTNSEGDFYLDGPINRAEQKLWGRPVIVTSALNESDRAFLIDFEGSTELVERDGVEVDWSENVYDPTALSGAGASDFSVNQVRFRAEARYGLKRKRPRGVIDFPIAE
jgi:HK97 family phage major capsid protein